MTAAPSHDYSLAPRAVIGRQRRLTADSGGDLNTTSLSFFTGRCVAVVSFSHNVTNKYGPPVMFLFLFYLETNKERPEI
jgi:hypothetical protein